MQQENTDTDVGGADTEENNVSSDASVSVLLCDAFSRIFRTSIMILQTFMKQI